MIDHLLAVADLSERFADFWGCGLEGRAAGLLHDLGKYSDLFQKVLKREEFHVDHASPGAFALLQTYKNSGLAAAIAVQGHHDGLVTGVPQNFMNMVDLRKQQGFNQKRYSSSDAAKLLSIFKEDGGKLPVINSSKYPGYYKNQQYISAMMYVRMLYSALTDADFLATEAHFVREGREYAFRPDNAVLNAEVSIQRLNQYRDSVKARSNADYLINKMRDDLYECCTWAGSLPRGIFTLTAPTGSGKTLASLSFALEHARTHGLNRVIFVLPYLNIIEQTAAEYEKIFQRISDKIYILQDHSLSETPDDDQTRLLAENWDSPVIITTTVKFFEGLFGNRSTVCRRLHNIACSVIIFDEAQTMPPRLAVHTLAAIADLITHYGCSAVFSTATQPAFEVLSTKVEKLCGIPWSPREIVPDGLLVPKKRVEVHWPAIDERAEWETIAGQVVKNRKALIIVNLRRHAAHLFKLVQESRSDGVYHLSTNMCSEHRKDVLAEVKRRLADPSADCILVSTQCIEAGVDVDFPVVFRSLAPLDAVIQSAGRCNRNGRMENGNLYVFLPIIDEEKYPDETYGKATSEVKLMLHRRRNIPGGIDIEDPTTVKEYYAKIFASNAVENERLNDAINSLDFVETAREYRWIDQHGINILVPYAPYRDTYNELCRQARDGNITREWIARARMLAVSAPFRKKSGIYDLLEPVINKRYGHREQTGWYILLREEAYSEQTGLNVDGMELDFIV
ncbi:MAG: CRISPR-associated helicase Cas3' [Peptococcaceae bacterium]|nr:CRISPR-associated helicase Cas3' [Peptococcaceae bacterium]